MKQCIFISSVQKELSQERMAVRDFIKSNERVDNTYIEKAGSGTMDIYENCRKAGIKPPRFRLDSGTFILTIWRKFSATTQSHPKSGVKLPTQSTEPVVRLLNLLKNNELSSSELRSSLGIRHRPTFRENYLHPALKAGLIEHTIPGKPSSRLQKYRITNKGRELLK